MTVTYLATIVMEKVDPDRGLLGTAAWLSGILHAAAPGIHATVTVWPEAAQGVSPDMGDSPERIEK